MTHAVPLLIKGYKYLCFSMNYLSSLEIIPVGYPRARGATIQWHPLNLVINGPQKCGHIEGAPYLRT